MAHTDNNLYFGDLGANANDRGPSGNNFTANGSPTFGGSAVTLNGTSQWLSSAASLLNGRATCTMAFWAKYFGSGGVAPLGEGLAGANGSCFYESGRLFFWGATGNQDNSPTLVFSSGAFHHYVIVRTATTVKTYKDGSLVDSFSNASVGNITDVNSGTSMFNIGRSPSGSGGATNYFKGDFSQFTIYSDAKDLTWIGDDYNSGTLKTWFDWNPGFSAAPATIPKNHAANLTITLAGFGTSWNNGTTIFTPSGVTGVTKISQNITSATAATLVITTDATHNGTLTITESVTGSTTATLAIATATLAIRKNHGYTGTTPSLTVTGTNTIWTQETAAGLFSVSGGTGDSIGTPTITTDTAGTATLTVGSNGGTLTITDNSTGATADFRSVAATVSTTGYTKTKTITALAANIAGSAAMNKAILAFTLDADILASCQTLAQDVVFAKPSDMSRIPHELRPRGQFITRFGGHSWFTQDEAVYKSGVLHVGYKGANTSTGYPSIASYTYGSDTLTRTVIGSVSEPGEDHGNPSILVRSSDSKLISAYEGAHNDTVLRYRISTSANDSTAWGSELTTDPNGTGGYAYSKLSELTGEGFIQFDYRGNGYAWGFIRSTDNGATWSAGTDVISSGLGTQPYSRTCNNGVHRIDYLMCNGNPAVGDDTKLLHFYYDSGTWKDSSGGTITPPFAASAATIFTCSGSDLCWIGDIRYKQSGDPHLFFVLYPGGDLDNHDLYYMELTSGTWSSPVKVCDLGAHFAGVGQYGYHSQPVLDEADDTLAWIPVQVNGYYEIQQWRKTAGTWGKEADITTGSNRNHIRPVVAHNCPLGKPGRVSFVAAYSYDSYNAWVAGIATYPPLRGWEVRMLADVDGASDTDIKVYYGNPTIGAQEYYQAVWVDYLAAITVEPWGSVAGYLRDSTGNSNPFITAPSLEVIDGPTNYGEPAKFPAHYLAEDYILSGNPNVAGFTGLTLEAWVNVSTSASFRYLWTAGYNSSNADFLYSLDAADIYGLVVVEPNTAKGNTTFSGATTTFDTWQYHTMGWSAAGGLVNSIDTTHGAIASTTGTALDATASSAVQFGNRTDDPKALDGYAFDMRITNNILLSSDRIDTYFNNFDLGNAFYTIGAESNVGVAAGTLTQSSVGSTTASLSYATVTGGTSPYSNQLRRSLVSGSGYSNVGSPQVGATASFSDTGLTASTSYYYIVVTTDNASQTATSNEVHVTTSAAPATDVQPTRQTSAYMPSFPRIHGIVTKRPMAEKER